MGRNVIPREVRRKLMLGVQGTLLTKGYAVTEDGSSLRVEVKEGSDVTIAFVQSFKDFDYNDFGWLETDSKKQKVTFVWKQTGILAYVATGIDKFDTAKLLKNVAEMVTRSQALRKRQDEYALRTAAIAGELLAVFPEVSIARGNRRGYIDSENLSGYIEPAADGQWKASMQVTFVGSLWELRQWFDKIR